MYEKLQESGRVRLITALTVAAVALWVIGVAIPGLGNHPTSADPDPERVEGNPSCATVIPGEFDHEEKIEPVEDGVFPFSFDGVSGEITLVVDEGAKTFDFSITGAVAVSVIVKGGPNANWYDYRPDGVSSDVDLHAPSRNGGLFGLSHISFCLAEAPPELVITKTAAADTITVGDKGSFTITVENVGQGTAENVVIDDTLPNDVLDWVENPDLTECAITGGNSLHCDVGDLDPTESFSITVETAEAIALGSELCGITLDNTAFTEADNHDQISEDASIDVICGAIEVNKFAKVPGSTDTQPVEGAGFTLFDNGTAVDPPGEVTTSAGGIACFDGLPVDTEFRLSETTTPLGYATVDDRTVTSSADNADCEGTGAPITVNVENQPLTDLSIDVEAQVPGATNSTIVCVDESDTEVGNSGANSDPASLDVEDLLPGTYTCTIVIDP